MPSLGGGGGNDDLRQGVKGASHGPQRLDVAFGDGLGDDRGIQEIPGVAWEQQPPAGFADVVPGAADALQRGGDGGRRLHEGHRVEGADVDAHFQRVRCHDGLELAILQASLHFGADFPRQRAMMGVGAGRRYALIEFQRDLLGHAAAVGEEQRGAVGVDHVLEGIRQGVPNLEAVLRREPGGFREPNRELDALLHARFDDADGPRGGSSSAVWQHLSADVAGHRFKRTHGGGQGDALHLSGHFHDAFEARHERHAAAVFHHRVDFVQDHGFDGSQGLAAPRGAQDEGQALRRGNEQFGRLAQHALAFAGRRVAAAGLGADAWERLATKLEEPLEFAQGLRQIAADVAVQRLER